MAVQLTAKVINMYKKKKTYRLQNYENIHDDGVNSGINHLKNLKLQH